jgi:phosphoglycerol transferase MdoB-like AlkP superfamily enzyme
MPLESNLAQMERLKKRWNARILNPVPQRCKWISRGLVSTVALGLVTIFAFATIFTTFVHWDDEGYFLLSYHEFLSGRIPYDQVSSTYGPFTFLSAALVARFDAINVTHDAFRWALLPVWILTASVMAGVVWRWTRRFSLTLAAFLLAGFHLRYLGEEVGYPQPWICLEKLRSGEYRDHRG